MNCDIANQIFRVPPRWLFVRVETAASEEYPEPIVGWGESTLEGHTEAVEGAFHDLRERFVGADTDGIEAIWQIAYRGRFYRGGPVLMVGTSLSSIELSLSGKLNFVICSSYWHYQSALSGLDIALWDIKGKRLGVPIYSLLGGKVRDRCAVYGWIGGDKPSDVVEGAKKRKEQGFKAVKMNGSGSFTFCCVASILDWTMDIDKFHELEALGWLDSPSALDATVERVRAVRELGLDVGVDFHGRVHLPMARQLARRLEAVAPLFIEEPVC